MNDENPVHFPANPDEFQFDAEVASIFPNMADRSIPIYRNMHKLHAKIVVDDYLEWSRWPENGTYTILDIGASRAEFADAIQAEVVKRELKAFNAIYIASDKSEAMVDVSTQHSPFRFVKYDLADPEDDAFDAIRCNVVAMHLVMQFIRPEQRTLAYQRLGDMVRPEGLLLYGEKETLSSVTYWSSKEKRIADAAREFYIDFRLENGYSREEIEAKTKALQNSMWESCYETDTRRNLEFVGFKTFIPTTRLGVFHSFVAIKGKQ